MTPRVLLIEDNEQNRYLATFLLEIAACVVEHAESGPLGIASASARDYDLILLDIQLPEMDGYEVARRLRAEARNRDVPIVAVTSYAMPGDREKALELGFTGYIEKPIDPERFVADVLSFVPDKP